MRKLILILGILGLMAGTALAEKPVGPKPINVTKATLDCSAMIEADCGGVYNGDNTGLVSSVDLYSCVSWNEAGGEVVYHLFFHDLTTVTATLSNMTADLDVFGLSDCDENACLDYGNTTFTYGPVTGDFFIVVDGYGGAESAFTLTIDCEVFIPENFCDVVMDPECNMPLAGDTCDSDNYVDSLPCGSYTEAGYDHWYSITVGPGGSFTAAVTSTADGALWVLDECFEPLNCLVYADDTFTGQEESITYMNGGTEANEVFLVVDSWGSGSCGTYTGTLVCQGDVVFDEGMSWGAAKIQWK